MPVIAKIREIVPGLALAAAVAAAAALGQRLEVRWLGGAWLEPLVLAILIGAAVRSAFGLGGGREPGVRFAAKALLEVAIVLLGLSMSLGEVAALGLPLVAGIAGVVAVAVPLSYLIGRALGLAPRLAALVACGNSICGNSAIVAAAPVIEAEAGEVAASIAFTAVLGILVVVLLPLVGARLGMGAERYGILAGMTVYAVPQVLAATAPFGLASTQVGTVVKLVRVLMLGPVILALRLFGGHGGGGGAGPGFGRLVPWFILGFLAAVAARSLGLVPPAGLAAAHAGSETLTLLSMAALGLLVDVRGVVHAGGRVLAAGVLSLAALALLGGALALAAG